MKKLVNDVHRVVPESLEGFAAAHSDVVSLHTNPLWVGRRQPKEDGKVAVISGGGFGHEPLHAGFVGPGMLDAAVPGEIFTSPTPDAIEAATRGSERGAGVLYLVKNYTGDVMNFDTAKEMTEDEDVSIRTVIVSDDCGVEHAENTAGRRGVAGTVLVEKIAGALAETGARLDEVAAIAARVNDSMATMGLALTACTVPYIGHPSFDLEEDQVEMGIGIHGEPGYRRGPMESAERLVEELYERVRDAVELTRGEQVITLVNGMGATPESELYICHRTVDTLLRADGVELARPMVGNWVTSLDMAGMSLTILKADAQMLELFDAPAFTAAWR